MSWLVAISGIIGGLVLLVRAYFYVTRPAQDKSDQAIDAEVADERKKSSESGRPVG